MFGGAIAAVTPLTWKAAVPLSASSGVGLVGVLVATESDRSATVFRWSGEVGTLAGVTAVEVGDGWR